MIDGIYTENKGTFSEIPTEQSRRKNIFFIIVAVIILAIAVTVFFIRDDREVIPDVDSTTALGGSKLSAEETRVLIESTTAPSNSKISEKQEAGLVAGTTAE